MPDCPKASGRNADSLVTILSSNIDSEQVRSVTFDDSTRSHLGEHRMTTNFNFSDLQVAETEQAAADFGEYRKMLREIAAGSCRRSKAEILAVLKAVDRDVKLLEEDVKKRTERDELIREIARVQEYEKEYEKTDKELDRVLVDFSKVEKAFNEKKWPLVHKCNGLKDKIRNIDGFRRKLIAECDDVQLIMERDRLEHQMDDPGETELYKKQRELADKIAALDRTLTNLPISRNGQEEKRELKARIAELRARYETGEQQKLEFTQRREKLKQAIREIENHMALA